MGRRFVRIAVLVAVLAALLASATHAQGGPRIVAVHADPLIVDEGDVVALEVEATHPDDAPMRFGWVFGNGVGLDPEPSARRTFTAYSDDGEFDVTVTAEDAGGRTDDATVRVTVRNVAPRIRGVDRDGATLEKNDVTFRSRVIDPGDDELSYSWDFGDGTVLGPGRTLDLVEHAYDAAGSYAMTLTVDDGDGGTATWTETIVVGAGLRFSASGAISAANEDGESPYLMGLPVVRAGRDVPLIDFEDPELAVRFSRPVDLGSAVANVVLEWRRADGNFEEVPILVIGEADDTLRLVPLDDLMDGVVYRARIVGGLQGLEGRDGEVLEGDEEWLFETVVDLSEDRHGVTLATTQVARDAPLVAGKPTETRVYLNWREKPHVHPEWQTRYATFRVEVEGGDYAPQRVRAKRIDLYGPVEKKYALDSVNFYGWEPGAGASHALTARATQAGQVGPERSFEGSWTADGYGDAPALTSDYHFVRVGAWAQGVPLEARRLGHHIARTGATFTEQTFPVPAVIARYRGDVVIEEPDEAVVEVMGEEFYLSSLATASRRDEVLVDAYADRLGATDADVVVAFLPPDVLRLSGFAYEALGTEPRVVGVQVDTAQEAADRYFASTVAHEIGHAFGLGHGSDCPAASVQACIDVGRSDAIEGTRIAPGGASGWNKSKWSGNAEVGRTPGVVLSLMHPSNLPDDAVFVTNEDYRKLMGAVRTLSSWPEADAWLAATRLHTDGGLLRVQDQRVPGLRVAGAIDVAAGRAVLTSVVPTTGRSAQARTAPDGSAPDDAAWAGLRLEVRSPEGRPMATVAIATIPPDSWHAPASAGSLRPFETFVPTTGPVGSVAVTADGRTLIDRHASAHPPELTVDAATIDLTTPGRLTWTATDPDGDPLRFDVDYAPDARDWRPLATGLRTPALRLSPDALPPGENPTIRIVASDGMRAAAVQVRATVSAAPRVVATQPAEGGVASPGTAITVWTLAQLDQAPADALVVVREDSPQDGTTRVSGRVERLPAGDGVRFVPDAPLAADAAYRATFGAGVTGADGTATAESILLVVPNGRGGAGARDSGAEPDRSSPRKLRGRGGRPGHARGERDARPGRRRASRPLRWAGARADRAAHPGRRHDRGGERGGGRLPPVTHLGGVRGRGALVRRARDPVEPAVPHRQSQRGRRRSNRRARLGVRRRSGDRARPADAARLGARADGSVITYRWMTTTGR